jgi:hypothetical protein
MKMTDGDGFIPAAFAIASEKSGVSVLGVTKSERRRHIQENSEFRKDNK